MKLTIARALASLAPLLFLASVSRTAHAEEDHPPPHAPAFTIGGQLGLGYWTESGPFGTDTAIGQGLALGYSAGLRASFEILPWLAIDGRGTLMHDQGHPVAGGGAMTTVGGFGALRFTAPFPWIRPYALLGGGGYHHAASGEGTTLVSGSVPAFVTGLGVLAAACPHLDVGVEYTYSFLVGETLSTNDDIDGGDPSQLDFFVQYRLDL